MKKLPIEKYSYKYAKALSHVNKLSKESSARGVARCEPEPAALRPFFIVLRLNPKLLRCFRIRLTKSGKFLTNIQSESKELTCRIHLDAVKLSEGHIDVLREQIKDAQEDVRFVIVPAENPGLFRPGMEMLDMASHDEQDRASEADIKEYLEWIHNQKTSEQ